jgi:hypothetical protein
MTLRLQLLFVCVLSVALAWTLFLDPSAKAEAYPIFLLYLYVYPFLASLVLFGGIHGAPQWAHYVTAIGGVLGTNLLLWFICRWVVRRYKARSNPTAETDARKSGARGSP